MRLRKEILVCFWALVWTAGLLAQSQAAAPQPEQKKKEKKWSFTLSGGLTANAGNTDNMLLNSGARFTLKVKKLEYSASLDLLYGTSGQKKIASKSKLLNNLAMRVNGHFNVLGLLNLEQDLLANVQMRTITGLGMEYVLSDVEKIRSKVSASINGEFVNSTLQDKDNRSVRLNVNYTSEWRFSKTARWLLNAFLTPNLANAFVDYRIEALTNLSVLMKAPIWLTLRLQDRYNNFPVAQTVKKNDLTFITSIEFAI